MLALVLTANFIASIISVFLAILIVSLIGSLLFTGENYKQKWGLSDDRIFKPLTNKYWKTFLIFFIGYSIIIGVIILLNKK